MLWVAAWCHRQAASSLVTVTTTRRRIGITRTVPLGLLLVALMAAFGASASAAGAVTLDGARAKALTATRTERARGGVVLFGLRGPIRAHASIREAGTRGAPAGLSTRAMPRVLTNGHEAAYFFYLDRGAYQAFEHPGRVLLVGAVTGRVVKSRTIRFGPTIDGRVPVFLRSRAGYESPRTRVWSRDYAVPGTAHAASAGLQAFGAEPAIALRSAASESIVRSSLAAEHACTIAIGGQRGDLATLGSASGAQVLPLLTYDQGGSTSLASFVTSEAIGRRGCRDLLLAISGDGRPGHSPVSTRTGFAPSGRRVTEYHVDPDVLRAIIAANPGATFKLLIDGPGSGAYVDALRSLGNVVLIATSSGAGQTAFRYLPTKRIGGEVVRNPVR
ncbi:MAG: hypothetical protein QOJ35_356, partial [Solirubrobacteraceae bacterium]|nr:hypothetical protein [Solirubrobacteraceae bacterium]